MQAREEIWLPVPGTDVEASNNGNIRSIGTQKLRRFRTHRPYWSVKIIWDGQEKWVSVHRLVAMAFFGPVDPNSGLQINHKDGNTHNNYIGNLEWVTPRQNADHAAVHGLVCCGERSPMSKLDRIKVMCMRARHKAGESCASLAREYGVCSSTAAKAIRGITWEYRSEGKQFRIGKRPCANHKKSFQKMA